MGFPQLLQLSAFSMAISVPQKGHFSLFGAGGAMALVPLAGITTTLWHFGQISPAKSSFDPTNPQFLHLIAERIAPQCGQRYVSLLTCFPH
jgi:hypothetical protein